MIISLVSLYNDSERVCTCVLCACVRASKCVGAYYVRAYEQASMYVSTVCMYACTCDDIITVSTFTSTASECVHAYCVPVYGRASVYVRIAYV